MSTRCQVQVVQEGLTSWEEKVTLYHHTDGYPSYVLPTIQKAYELSGGGWEAGRARKVASFLCAADPGVFEPEEGHDLHGDIAYYYRLFVVNGQGGSTREKPRWDIEVFKPGPFREFWDKPSEELLACAIQRMPLEEALRVESAEA